MHVQVSYRKHMSGHKFNLPFIPSNFVEEKEIKGGYIPLPLLWLNPCNLIVKLGARKARCSNLCRRSVSAGEENHVVLHVDGGEKMVASHLP